MASLDERIRELIAEQTGMTASEITDDVRLREDLKFDSLDAVETGVILNNDLGIDVPDEAIGAWVTVADVIKDARQLVSEQPQIPSDSAWQPPGT